MTEHSRRLGPFNKEQPRHGSSSRDKTVPGRLGFLHQGYKDKESLREFILSKNSNEQIDNEQKIDLGNHELPAYEKKQEIIDLVDNYKASILGGPTGSGKSTQVPQFLYESGMDKIYVLVPRRVIADNLYDRLREELSQSLGEEEAENLVGIMHGERTETDDNNRISVMTPNTFLRAGNDIESKYGDDSVGIIADEIHEANLYTEIAAGVGLKAVQDHENWRFVAMSATHNESVLQEPLSAVNGGVTPSLNIEGRPYELEHIERPEQSVMDAYVDECEDVHKTMLFTSGKKEIDHIIEQTKRKLDAKNPGSSNYVIFRKLHSELTDREMSHINDPVPEGYRIAIVSSPAGMSGITIPGVTCVLSDGTINREELDNDDVAGLKRNYLSQAGVIQQFGRAGRDTPGGRGILCRPVMVEEDRIRAKGQIVEEEAMPYIPFSDREGFEPPEIYSTNLSSVALSVANLNKDFSDTNRYLPNRVADSAIIKAQENLVRLSALDDDLLITETGRNMSEYPIRPELSRGIVEAMKSRRPLMHMARLAIIAASVGAGGIQDFTDKNKKEWTKLLQPSTTDDMMAQYDIFTSLPEGGVDDNIEYLEDFNLSYKRVKQANKVAKKIMRKFGIHPDNIVHSPISVDEAQLLRDDLATGMIDFTYNRKRSYKSKTYYRNIHSSSPEQDRFLSERSITDSNSEYIVGFPRWYTTRSRGDLIKHDIVEQTMPISPEIIGKYAAKAGLLQYKDKDSYLNDGRVVERTQPMFGEIKVGKLQDKQTDLQNISKEAKDHMIEIVLNRQGNAQKALRLLVKELDHYSNSVPKDVLESHMKPNAPEFISNDYINNLIAQYAERATVVSDIDNLLRSHMYSNNLGIEQYFLQDDREYLQACSPQQLYAGGVYMPIQYMDDAEKTPYITMHSNIDEREFVESLLELRKDNKLSLVDGREIKISTTDQGEKRLLTIDSFLG